MQIYEGLAFSRKNDKKLLNNGHKIIDLPNNI